MTLDDKQKILEKIIHGENLNSISIEFKVSINVILSILGDRDFAAKLLELFTNQAKGMALIAHNNIARIAFDTTASAATQLKASKALVDIARELQELSPNDLEPAYMSQNQLADRLKALQKEAINRAKPINTGVIEHTPTPSLDDMID